MARRNLELYFSEVKDSLVRVPWWADFIRVLKTAVENRQKGRERRPGGFFVCHRPAKGYNESRMKR